jgi:tetratricopeptide (TPR) repeat protein
MSHADFPYSEKALSLAQQGKIAEALDFYDLALEKHPDNDVILNNKAIALITIGRYEEALDHSRRAVVINPDSADIWINLGVALQKLNKLGEAGDALERAVEINPYDAYARALLGIIYQKLNQEDRAKAQNRQLQELIFPNEYAGFYFGTAAFLLGMLIGGIRSVEGRPFEITISSQIIILIFFCLICVLYWKSLRRQQEVNRNVIIVPYLSPVQGDRSTRGMYTVLFLMIVVFAFGAIAGGDIWNWMR